MIRDINLVHITSLLSRHIPEAIGGFSILLIIVDIGITWGRV